MLRRLVATAGLALVAAGSAGAATQGFPHFGAGCARADFRSGGATVRAERCGRASGPRAVIVLHGCGGFGTFDHTLAVDLPRFGIATLDVDLFARTPPPSTKGFCDGGRGAGSIDPFPIWEQTAADAARSLRAHYAHVGAVGWSLGAGVAIATAEDLRPFAALAAFSAFAPPPALARAGRLPPSIFLDGGDHDIVPPQNARDLYAAATRDHVASALFVYPNGSHGWPGEQGVAGRRRAAGFLLRHLR
jgi:dienelactone hydrolase